MPASHLEIAGSAGFSSLPIKSGFLPKHYSKELCTCSQFSSKGEGSGFNTSVQTSLDLGMYGTAPVVVDNMSVATRRYT